MVGKTAVDVFYKMIVLGFSHQKSPEYFPSFQRQKPLYRESGTQGKAIDDKKNVGHTWILN